MRNLLRRECRTLHDRVDEAFSRFSLSDDSGIERFLAAQAGALRPIECSLEAGSEHSIRRLLPDWSERRRAYLLDGLDANAPEQPFPPFHTASRIFGAAYVLEGSRLGARVLLRRVVPRDTEAVRLVTAFLSHGIEGRLWPSFLATLDTFAGEIEAEECVSAAKAAFAVFEASAISADEEARESDRVRMSWTSGYRSESLRHSLAPLV